MQWKAINQQASRWPPFGATLNAENHRIRQQTRRVRAHRSYVRPTSDPVSDEEQKMILEMVQNNQISIEEAEVLLAALEGKAVNLPSTEKETETPVDSSSEEEVEEIKTEDKEETKE